MSALAPGSVIDGFRLGEKIHTGSMAVIFRLTGPDGPLPLIMKIPRLGAGPRPPSCPTIAARRAR